LRILCSTREIFPTAKLLILSYLYIAGKLSQMGEHRRHHKNKHQTLQIKYCSTDCSEE